MIKVELDELYDKKFVALWSLLSFKAGLLNAAGFLITGSYVSHVTGFGTQIGIATVHHEYDFGLELLVIPICFIFGGVIASMVLDKGFREDKLPNFPLVQFFITFLLFVVNVLFYADFFHIDSYPLPHNEMNILLIGLLCLICGLKNGLTTWSTHGKIRTTHLTGLSTDIGLHLPKIFSKEGLKSKYPEPRKITYVRLITFLSFSSGSIISTLLVLKIGYLIFTLAFVISFCLLLISYFQRVKLLSPPLKLAS